MSSAIEVIVGTLGRAHGLSGEVFVDVATDSPELRFARGTAVRAGTRELTVDKFRMQSGRGILQFREVGDRTEAESLTGRKLTVVVDESESPEEGDEFFDHQLVGLSVVATRGETVGVVVRVEHLGYQDMLVVSTVSGDRYVPFVDALVPEVDLAAGLVRVNAIPGLLTDADEQESGSDQKFDGDEEESTTDGRLVGSDDQEDEQEGKS